jgi:hypothetical protein
MPKAQPESVPPLLRVITDAVIAAYDKFGKSVYPGDIARIVYESIDVKERAELFTGRDKLWCEALLSIGDTRIINNVLTHFNSHRPD